MRRSLQYLVRVGIAWASVWALTVSAQLPVMPSPAASASIPPAKLPGLSIFDGADLGLGARLIGEHGCDNCHRRQVGGDGRSIYRPQGRINSPAALRGMVENCNLELNLALFPDEVTAIAAVLQRDHYRFK